MLFVGEGTVDITPPLGIEMAGFHKPPGQERVVEGIRRPAAARALVLRVGEATVAILSIDMCAVSADFAKRVQTRVQTETGIPAAHVRVCATHTHSMPTFRYLRQWGAISPEFMASVETNCIAAVKKAVEDLSEADCYVGTERVEGGNSNRTAKEWKADESFTADSSDEERWLDTTLHVLYFQRANGKSCPQWYHFCAHPVCYQNNEAGPDWPGLVAEPFVAAGQAYPSLLQGHIGDVNPGDGAKWIGDPEPTARSIALALHHAVEHGNLVRADEIRVVQGTAEVPYDFERLDAQLAHYRDDPEECTNGVWVDAAFAKAWYESAKDWDRGRMAYAAPISAMRIGGLALLFHPAELYSYYGLRLRFDSPFSHTLCVGFCDDLIGYVTDPKAYADKEYAAVVVPKITDLPPFTETSAREFSEQCGALLQQLT